MARLSLIRIWRIHVTLLLAEKISTIEIQSPLESEVLFR